MTEREISQIAVKYHDAAEELENVIVRAIDDGRFKLTVDEARKVRDLIDDAEVVANRAWRGMLQIPLDQTKEYAEKVTIK